MRCLNGRSNRIEIHIGRASQQRCLIENSHGAISTLKKFADFVVIFISACTNVLTEQTHPSSNIAQSGTDRSELKGIIPNGVESELIWLFWRSVGFFAFRAEHEPSTSHFGVIPRRDDIRPRTQDQMKIIRDNREA